MERYPILMTLLMLAFALDKTMEYIKLDDEQRQRYGKALRNVSIVLWCAFIVAAIVWIMD